MRWRSSCWIRKTPLLINKSVFCFPFLIDRLSSPCGFDVWGGVLVVALFVLFHFHFPFFLFSFSFHFLLLSPQEISALLGTQLTAEDNDEVERELDEILKEVRHLVFVFFCVAQFVLQPQVFFLFPLLLFHLQQMKDITKKIPSVPTHEPEAAEGESDTGVGSPSTKEQTRRKVG